jgi:predicted transcriptional regulator
MMRRIVIRKVSQPREATVQKDVEWLCSSLGFCKKNVNDSASMIIKEILNHVAKHESVPTEAIATALNMHPGTVNHHVRQLVDAGFLYRDKKRICLRGGSLKRAVREMRRDTDRMFEDLERIAETVDRRIGLRNR